MSIEIRPGGLIRLDPSDVEPVVWDWDDLALPASVTITTSTWTITVIKQNGLTALTKDNESILSGSRRTQVRLIATTATAGDQYYVANKIVTNESPTRTVEKQVKVLIENQ
jgi:hypothetical protein